MKRIFKYLKYHKGQKGIALVWMALMLTVLLMLAGLAIDIGYMYYVKNQLQVAADAAALAGVAELDPAIDDKTSAFGQMDARQGAWRFACNNTAAGSNVYLVTNSSTDCDSPPSSGLNETDNNTDGDIVVGHWRLTNDVGCSTTWEVAGSGYFCRANGSTGLQINALQARPRRISTGASYGMPPVRVFLGQIFRMTGGDWSFMSAAASAIATAAPLQHGPFPICSVSCGTVTPITVIPPNLTPGTRLNLKSTPYIGWTTFLDKNTSKNNIEDYVRGIKTPLEICLQCIYTTQGVVGPSPCVVREMIKQKGDNYEVNGVEIFGWRVLIPILPDIPCPGGKGTGCFGDPGYQPGDAYNVTRFAEVIITDGVPQGNCPGDPGPLAPGEAGIVLVGTGPGASGTSTINCLDCNDPVWETLAQPPRLVK